jgi:acyl carrier protein
MGEKPDVGQKVKEIVSEILEIPLEKIEEHHAFVDDLEAESIQSVELMASFEEAFNIEMDEEQAMGVKTVGAAIEYIKRCIQEQQP